MWIQGTASTPHIVSRPSTETGTTGTAFRKNFVKLGIYSTAIRHFLSNWNGHIFTGMEDTDGTATAYHWYKAAWQQFWMADTGISQPDISVSRPTLVSAWYYQAAWH